MRLHEVSNKADSPCKSFVEAVWCVRCPGTIPKLWRLQELGKSHCTMKVELVARETIHQQEDIAAASHAMTDAGTFLQQATLPRQLSTSFTCCEVAAVIRPREMCLGKQVDDAYKYSMSIVTPVSISSY